jgi:hypothetical protein
VSLFRIANEDIEDDDDVESAFNAIEDAIYAICGICIFWPIMLLYIGVAFSISLRGRDVYGSKHSTSTLIGFFLGIGGVITALAGTFLFLIIFGGEVGMPISLTIPVIMIAVGMFLFIKDVGGMLFGAIGMGLTCLSQFGLMAGMFMVFSSDSVYDSKGALIIGIIAIIFTMIGIVVMIVGFIQSYMWMKKNKPLIDEEQEKSLQMQQQQLNLQQQQLEMQKQQLQLQQQQAGYISQGQPTGHIPSQATPPGQVRNNDPGNVWGDNKG